DDRGDQRKAFDPVEERVFDGLPEMPGEGQKALRRQGLAGEEDHQMVEPGAPDGGDRAVVEVFGEIEPGNLGAQSARDRMNLERMVGHQLMIFNIDPSSARRRSWSSKSKRSVLEIDSFG